MLIGSQNLADEDLKNSTNYNKYAEKETND